MEKLAEIFGKIWGKCLENLGNFLEISAEILNTIRNIFEKFRENFWEIWGGEGEILGNSGKFLGDLG